MAASTARARRPALASGVADDVYRQLFESSADAIVVTDRDGRVQSANPAARRLLDAGEADLRERLFAESIVDSERRWREATEALRATGTFRGEFALKTAAGAAIRVDVVSNAFRDVDGTPHTSWILRDTAGRTRDGSDNDVSERRRAEAALMRHTANLEALHQITLDLLNRRDMDDLLRAIVEQASAMLDAPCGELMLKEGDALVVRAYTSNQAFLAGDRVLRGEAGLAWLAHDARQPIVLDDYCAWPHHRAIYEPIGVRSVADFPIIAGDECIGVLALGHTEPGRVFAADEVRHGSLFAQLVAIVLDNARSYAGALRELTERERAQKALTESELKLASIIDSAMDAVVTVDGDEKILVFNASAESMFRCAAEDAIGTSLERFIPQARAGGDGDIVSFARSAVAGRASGRFDSLTGVRADGEAFPLEASVSFVQVDDKPLYTLFLRDLTERRRADELRAELEARLRDAQKMEAIGTLAGGIAHDFNNIVAAIVGNVELARHALENGQDAFESLAEIRVAGHRARDLVEQMLTFSQKRAPRRELVAMADVVAEAAKLVRSLLPANVELVVETAGFPAVLADATQIHRVVLNLATNAAHAMEGRRGTIRMRIDEARWEDIAAASRAALARGPYARLTVTDDGKGMDAATKARAFEPFFTTKRVGEGTGLGLSVVHGIVTAHSGLIVLDSEPGRGTRFELYFPAVEPKQRPAAQRGPARGARILYVDDDDALAFLASRLLRRSGFDVATSGRADEALGLVRADPHAFDLVVTDVNMPGLSGLEMARALKALNGALPVVLTSGYVNDRLRADATEIGVDDIVYKQNTVEELCAVVGEIARRRCKPIDVSPAPG